MPFKNRLVVTFRPRYIFRFNKNSTASSNNFDLLKTLLSSETYSALGNVRSIIQKLESENVTGVENVFHRYSSWDIYQSVLSLSYLQKQRQQQRQEQHPPQQKQISPELISTLTKYSIYSSAVYGWALNVGLRRKLPKTTNNLTNFLKATNLTAADVIHADLKSKTGRPAFIVVKDTTTKTLVVTIRGTLSFKDVLTDLCCEGENVNVETSSTSSWFRRKIVRAPDPNFAAHSGFLTGARSISKRCKSKIATFLEDPANKDYKIVLTGHSLGAATAVLLKALWADSFKGFQTNCYVYGVPCVGEETGYVVSKLDNVVGVVVENDPFATISLGHLVEISRRVGWFCREKEVRERVCKMRGEVGGEIEARVIWEKMEEALKLKAGVDFTTKKFFPPGELYKLAADGKELTRVENRREEFGEFLLKKVGLDFPLHVPNVYEDSMRKLNSSFHKV
ncbi:hypothetical protein ScalyP_jg11005 [Parmales sp. scaly parma]|nr:hypothetical protein ScalyP_jg11005 [Parmales sp. scaly parma]